MRFHARAGHRLDRGIRVASRRAFDANGLIPCVTVDAATGDVLMLAWMNAEALRLTLETGFVHYWSRSRQALWKKGETSGALQRVVELRTDCDQDACSLVRAVGDRAGTCHTGRPTCFYRSVPLGAGPARARLRDAQPRLTANRRPAQAVAIYSRICSASRSTSSIRRFTTSPIETMPASLPSSTTGRWRKRPPSSSA